MEFLFGALAAVAAIIAGVYLLQTQSASDDPTVFDALMHGIGGYFLARGLWMISSLIRADRVRKQALAPPAPPSTAN
jgi:hypothetical protein